MHIVRQSGRLKPQERHVRVCMSEWRQSDRKLFTGAAFTCLVMAAHNSVTKQGLLGHFSNLERPSKVIPITDKRKFDNASTALERLGEPEHTSIWLGGGTPCYAEDADLVAVDRDYALERIGNYIGQLGLSTPSLQVEWSRGRRTVIDVLINCQQGVLTIGRYTD